MIKRSLESRVTDLERKLPTLGERLFEEKARQFFERFGVPDLDDFVFAWANRDQLDQVNSAYLSTLRETGGIALLQEMLRMMGKLEDSSAESTKP